MKPDPTVIEELKAKLTGELLEAHKLSRGAFDLDKALASAQGRLSKAIELATIGAVIPFTGKHCAFIVVDYFVTTEGLIVGCECPADVHCQCEDHRHRKGRCKHILAAGLFARAAGLNLSTCNL